MMCHSLNKAGLFPYSKVCQTEMKHCPILPILLHHLLLFDDYCYESSDLDFRPEGSMQYSNTKALCCGTWVHAVKALLQGLCVTKLRRPQLVWSLSCLNPVCSYCTSACVASATTVVVHVITWKGSRHL